MKGIHPKSYTAATCALIAALCAGGCRSTSSGINNPFFAPDRVAPPSTRVIAPGQAQPYYQGDPLPVMQSATGQATNALVASDSATTQTASGRTLAWNSPASGVPAGANTLPPSTPELSGVTPQSSTSIAAATETPIAVPADTDSLRFPLPAAAPQPAPQLAAAAAPSPPPAQTASTVPTQPVSLASYNAPATNGSSTVTAPPTLSPIPQQATSPWRTPQIAAATPPAYAQQPSVVTPTSTPQYTLPVPPAYAMTPPLVAMPTNPMAVELRAVPSPPPQPGDPMPRVRIPGYKAPQTASADGFRPRTSMR